MRFSIFHTEQNGYTTISIKNKDNHCSVEIFSFGALLNHFSIIKNNEKINVVDGYKNINDAIAQKNTWFKSCKLNPFVCRLENGTYNWQNNNYKVDKFYLNNHAIHGLIYDANYSVEETEINENSASVLLSYLYHKKDKGYPFTYTTQIRYTLNQDNTLQIATKIINESSLSIPMADGWHPYFKLDCTINECYLTFKAKQRVEFDEEMIPTGKLILENNFDTPQKIGKKALDECYTIQHNSSCILQGKNIALHITPLKNYPYLQLFIPNHRESIAIENLSALPNTFNNLIGLIELLPNQQIEFGVAYTLI
jgi:aldose 1-epimerase